MVRRETNSRRTFRGRILNMLRGPMIFNVVNGPTPELFVNGSALFDPPHSSGTRDTQPPCSKLPYKPDDVSPGPLARRSIYGRPEPGRKTGRSLLENFLRCVPGMGKEEGTGV